MKNFWLKNPVRKGEFKLGDMVRDTEGKEYVVSENLSAQYVVMEKNGNHHFFLKAKKELKKI